ncbi:hypothetical protein GL50803_0011153 [Giardia duodenalis]|uniref:Uncharacterized protein n=2 Tax=Giardia intestinalis TaxID=5741 RepID=A8BV20_GIAIC|nr:hypothetical protein GL50803_0011153 [Giardia intestinalis]ESU39681.1 Hypothetical protein DHA2_11153 [Giardia intestinalis]KAE8304527.1 hypothetical protein GL50803_0011153 [Giardia intestinalis]|eukprot:XP_001704705.1 Hypothetical protein GL50803_11153 [Giardia lamblia ATCC 50803]
MSIDYRQVDYSSDVISYAKTLLTLQIDSRSIPILNTIVQNYVGDCQYRQQRILPQQNQKSQQAIKK